MYALVLAMDVHGVIGKNNDLPWHFPEDLKYFKQLTSGHTVLMGRKTFESIVNRLGKPLPNRMNLVATRKGIEYPNVKVISDLVEYLKQPREENIFIIGGKQVFDIAYPFADILYITYVKHLYDGDTFLTLNYEGFEMSIIKETNDLIFTKYVRKYS